MAQETAASATAPEGPIWRAWLDAFIHLEYETYTRWYPRMNARWRRISLAASLLLILVTCPLRIVLAVYSVSHNPNAFEWHNLLIELFSLSGAMSVCIYCVISLAVLFAMPIVVAAFANRGIGPYRVRLYVAFGPWLQVQPAVCLFLLLSSIAQLVLTANGIVFPTPLIAEIVILALVIGPALNSWIYSCRALAAGSGRYPYQVGLIAAIPGLLYIFLLTSILPTILSLGRQLS
jgi:hypothetical protein